MGLYIIAGILLLPLVEISVFIMVGGVIGILPTILLTVLTAVAGTALLRQQGVSLIMRMQAELDQGRTPASEVMHGAMIVLASILLLIPGFMTDAIGLALFVPTIRSALADFIVSRSNVVVTGAGSARRSPGDGVVDLETGDWAEKDRPTGKNLPGSSPWQDENGRSN